MLNPPRGRQAQQIVELFPCVAMTLRADTRYIIHSRTSPRSLLATMFFVAFLSLWDGTAALHALVSLDGQSRRCITYQYIRK
eukprot:s2526_g10.t1